MIHIPKHGFNILLGISIFEGIKKLATNFNYQGEESSFTTN